MHDPLRVSTLRLEDGSEAFATSGGPAESRAALAALGVLDVTIDMVVAGINNGHNMELFHLQRHSGLCARPPSSAFPAWP